MYKIQQDFEFSGCG